MRRRRAFLGMLIAMMAGFYMLGSSRAAWACAVSQCSACAVPGADCKHAMSANDCAPACAAVMPATPEFSKPILSYADVSSEIAAFEVALRPGPEPPPPRLG